MTVRTLLPVEEWARAACDADPLARATLDELHEAYVRHAAQTNRRHMGPSFFSAELSRLPGMRKADDVNGWLGLRVRRT